MKAVFQERPRLDGHHHTVNCKFQGQVFVCVVVFLYVCVFSGLNQVCLALVEILGIFENA